MVDPAVLAERRARRAEIAEESLGDRLRAAERTADEQRVRALELEHGLQLAARERDALRQELGTREGELRTLRQREEAERRRRLEVEVEADAERRALEAEVERLRVRLGLAEARAAQLADDLVQARSALQATRDGVAAEIAEVRVAAGSLAEALSREERARAAAEAELADERDRARVEIERLQSELDRRSEMQSAVTGRLRSLGSEVSHVREALAGEDERRRTVELSLADVATTADALRTQVDELVAGRDRAAEQLSHAHSALTAREQELGRVRGELAQAHAAVDAVRAEALRAEQALQTGLAEQQAGFDGQIAVAEETARELRLRLAEAGRALDDRLAEERRALATVQETLRRERESAAQERAQVLAAQADLAAQLTAATEAVAAEQERANAAEAALARRMAFDGHVRESLSVLRGELEQLRVGEHARAEREAAVDRLVADLVGTARELREAFDQELDAVRGQFEVRAATERASELAAADARLQAMREHLETSVAVLRDELVEEQSARHDAEHALEAERIRTEMAGLAAVDAAVARDDLARELAERRAAEADARAALAAAEQELALLRREPSEQADALAVVESLTRAARRLREESAESPVEPDAASADAPSPDAPSPDAPSSDAPSPDTPSSVASSAGTPPADDLVADELVAALATSPAAATAETSAAAAPASAPAASAPAVPDPVDAGVPAGPREGAIPVRPYVVPAAARTETGWLAAALQRLAGEDPELALQALLQLLVAQGPAVGRNLSYDVVVRGRGTWRVVLQDGCGSVAIPVRGEAGPPMTIVGDVPSLVPLAAGGAGRKLPGIDVVGGRRRLRKLAKRRRAPVGLVELNAASVHLSPPVLLALLAGSVPGAIVDGPPFTVDYAVTGEAAGTWRVTSTPGGGLRVSVPADDAPPADAVVHIADVALLPLLAALPLPPGERQLVNGDLGAVQRLHGLLASVQGLPPAAPPPVAASAPVAATPSA